MQKDGVCDGGLLVAVCLFLADTKDIEQLLGSLKTGTTLDESVDVDAGVAKTLQNMAKAAEGVDDVGTDQVEAMGEEMMSEMMKKFEEMGEKVRKRTIWTVRDVIKLMRNVGGVNDAAVLLTERFPRSSRRNDAAATVKGCHV